MQKDLDLIRIAKGVNASKVFLKKYIKDRDMESLGAYLKESI